MKNTLFLLIIPIIVFAQAPKYQLVLTDSISGNALTIKAHAPNGDTTLTLPAISGGSDSAIFAGAPLSITRGANYDSLHLPSGSIPIVINQSLIDLDSSCSVNDTSLGMVYIAATSDPGNPILNDTIRASWFPANSQTKYVKQWGCSISLCGKDTSTTSNCTINILLKKNGSTIGSSNNPLAVTVTKSDYWLYGAQIDSIAIQTGDIISVDIWASTANQLNFQAAVIYIYPQSTITATNNYFIQEYSPSTTVILSSGITGNAGALSNTQYDIWDSIYNVNFNGSSLLYNKSTLAQYSNTMPNLFATQGQSFNMIILKNSYLNFNGAQTTLKEYGVSVQRFFKIISFTN